jgi:predicted DsbA family dithiol-disulfide isomerase
LHATIGAIARELGIPFLVPDFVPWSRKAHELAMLAGEKGCFAPVHQTLFEAHFVRGLDIGRVDILTGLGQECGLDPAEVRTVLGVDRFGPEVNAIRSDLLREGIRGVPFFHSSGRSLMGFTSAEELTSYLESL